MNSNGTSECDIAEYHCMDGYRLTSDSDSLICMDTGMWTGVMPSCIAGKSQVTKYIIGNINFNNIITIMEVQTKYNIITYLATSQI